MEVFTFEPIPTQVVEVPKIVLPTWAKITLAVLGVVTFVAIIATIWKNKEKKELAQKLQSSVDNEQKLKSENQKMSSDNQKLTEKLNYYTGGRNS